MRSLKLLTPWLVFAAIGLVALAPSVQAEQTPATAPAPRVVEIKVAGGYHPDRVTVPAGEPVRLAFTRTEYSGCTLEVVFPTLGVRAKLPTNQRVEIDLGPLPAGEIPFHCGMNMVRGTLIVEAKQ